LAATLRLCLIVLTMAYCAVFRVDHALGSAAQGRLWTPRLKSQRPRVQRAAAAEPLGLRIAGYARQLLGVPYRWGGDTPGTGFDCSGLVRFVYAHFGVKLPHSTYADFDLGVRVPRRSLRPGDLVFFDGVGHVGLYIGDGRFIHAPHTGTDVQITSLSAPWYEASYDGARRLIANPVQHAVARARANPLWASLGLSWRERRIGTLFD
jgi:hypothetical protein